MTEKSDDSLSSFGFRDVSPEQKAGLVRGVFDSVAGRYDLMNDLMSGGVHRLWKSAMLDWLAPRGKMRLLDVAGGTGDIAFRFRARGEVSDEASVIVCDINHRMLQVGRDRAIDRGLLRGVEWVCANAEALPIPDQSVDAYTIAFGIRNVTDIPAALREARRVLRPGGRFMCLEFSRVTVPGFERLYDLYSFQVVPQLGRWVARDEAAYRYLVESIRRFPDQDTFARMIGEAGLEQVKWRSLTGGIAALHSAWRI